MKVRCKLLQYLLQHIPHLLTSLCRFTETSDIGETLQHLKDKSFADFYRNMESHLGVALLLRQKCNGRRKKSINTGVCELSHILETVVYYKVTTKSTTQ